MPKYCTTYECVNKMENGDLCQSCQRCKRCAIRSKSIRDSRSLSYALPKVHATRSSVITPAIIYDERQTIQKIIIKIPSINTRLTNEQLVNLPKVVIATPVKKYHSLTELKRIVELQALSRILAKVKK